MSKLSPQTLSEKDRRLVAGWAADCAERVLGLFESELPQDDRPRNLIKRTRAFADGSANIADEIRDRFKGGVGRSDVESESAMAAARSAGQAFAVAHMGAHALGAAGYAVKAVRLANRDNPTVAEGEIQWQVGHMTDEVRTALKSLPMVGENSSGPLGPGLLPKGEMGEIVRRIQEHIISER